MLRRRRGAKIIGFIDGMQGSKLRGWAADSNAFDDVLEIIIVAEGRTIGNAKADQFRSDLLAAGYGQGFHGFEVSLADVSMFTPSFEVLAFRPNASYSKTPLTLTSIAYAQVTRAYYSQFQAIDPPKDIQESCRKAREGCFEVSDRAPTDVERVFFSDELFVKTILACAVKA